MTAPSPNTIIRPTWITPYTVPLTRRARLRLAWHDACDTAADGAIRALGVCAGWVYAGIVWGSFWALLGGLCVLFYRLGVVSK